MKINAAQLLVGLCVLSFTAGCRSVDPAAQFFAKMDGAPEASRPKDWDHTKSLMARRAPSPGQSAPNFTLPTPEGSEEIELRRHQAGRPLVLVFGSFT